MAESKYEIINISKNSWRIEDDMVRMFLFEGTNKAMLVDTGFGNGNVREVVKRVTQKPVMLVNTHADPDHCGCNDMFDTTHMHPSEYPYYFENNPLNTPVSPLWDGDIIDLGSWEFEVILIPGHTPGSIALLDRKNKVLISGDSISETPVFMFGKHRSLAAFIHSLEKLKKMDGAFDTIYPSHGPFPISADKISKVLIGAKKLMNGELEGQDPPFDLPAKMYVTDGAAFFYN